MSADLAPLFAARRTALTGGIPLPVVQPLAVHPTQEPIFYGVLRDLGASWLGVAATGREVLAGRVLDADEPCTIESKPVVS